MKASDLCVKTLEDEGVELLDNALATMAAGLPSTMGAKFLKDDAYGMIKWKQRKAVCPD